jgi:fructokinase
MNTQIKPPVIFGEVLFDNFPDGSRVLGGAPFNVAWHLQVFGLAPCFISRVGDDVAGREIADLMTAWGMCRDWLQTDTHHPTGSVQVSIDDGEPAYDIVQNSAYDFVDAAVLAELNTQGILYHGSLAIRNPVSFAALQAIKASHQGKIFVDVNLRAPWWQPEILLPLLHDADWLKLNEDELFQLCPDSADLQTAMPLLYDRFNLEILFVTCGENGAVAYAGKNQFTSVRPVAGHAVVDTVGAGDAFSAVLLLGLSRQWPLQTTLERSQDFAGALVGRRGATVHDLSFYQDFIRQWI